jgi:hypothetical protein
MFLFCLFQLTISLLYLEYKLLLMTHDRLRQHDSHMSHTHPQPPKLPPMGDREGEEVKVKAKGCQEICAGGYMPGKHWQLLN